MLSDGQQAADFIKVLYPTLQSAGLGSVGITCCDAEGWNDQKTFTADLITAGVQGMLSKITSHAYTSQPNTPITTTLRVWQTEYTDLSGAWSTTVRFFNPFSISDCSSNFPALYRPLRRLCLAFISASESCSEI